MPLLLPKVRSDLEFFDDHEVEGESVVVVRDPVRGTYFKYNPLQAAMLRSLDGVRSVDQMVATLSQQFDVEIPRQAATRFITHARKMMLLDVASYNVSEAKAHKNVLKALEKQGWTFRGLGTGDPGLNKRVVSAEAVMFMGGLRHLQAGHPAKALDYFRAVLELNPKNQRAQTLADTIQTAYVKALSGATSDFPTFWTFDPTRILSFLDRTIGKLVFSWLAVIPMIALVTVALYCYSITPSADLDVGVVDVVLAFALTMVYGLMHELGHGLACYHYGGKVPEIGFTLFYYVRLFPYCDTSSSYLFKNRKHQVAVQLGGAVASVIFLCLMVIFLAVIHPGVFIYQSAQLMLLISNILIFVNLIPFVKFDGYYALCDYVGVPNLRERSIKLFKSWLGTRLLGLPASEEPLPPRKRKLFFAFALLSLVFTAFWIYQALFKVLVFVVERYRGIGLVLSLVVLGLLLRGALFRPLGQLLRLVVRERRRVFTLRRGIVILLLLAAFVAPWLIEWPIIVDADFALVPKQRIEVRAQTPGLIERVLVHEGDVVRRGQPLVQLRNDDLDLEARVVQAELEGLDSHLAQLREGARPEELELASRQVGTAQATLAMTAKHAAVASTLAKTGMGTNADSAKGSAAVSRSLTDVARWRLATLKAGSRPEAIAAAEAERARLTAQLDQANEERALLTIRSPIDGVIVTKHLEDRLYAHLDRGDSFAEIHDVSSFVAEIALPVDSPLAELKPGDQIALRAVGAPGHDIACAIGWVRAGKDPAAKAKAAAASGTSDLVVVTTPFEMPTGRAGMVGHARLYGTRRSLAYSKLYLPLERVFRIQLWSLM